MLLIAFSCAKIYITWKKPTRFPAIVTKKAVRTPYFIFSVILNPIPKAVVKDKAKKEAVARLKAIDGNIPVKYIKFETTR